jgi:pimeloyl-ACP methyl ester carboxylesterase
MNRHKPDRVWLRQGSRAFPAESLRSLWRLQARKYASVGWISFVTVLAGIGILGCVHTEEFRDSDGHIIPASIATMELVTIGGLPQSVWFRGMDRRNPAVILLHGGPGASESALFRYYDAELERYFVMVYWEQRGAGRSYRSDIPRDSMTLVQFEQDLDEVVDLTRQRFGKKKVILLGHSWGTVLGTIYASRHPDKVSAYVGVAQIADFAEGQRVSHKWAMAQAARRNEQDALTELAAMGALPRTVDEELALGRWTERFGGVFHGDLSTGTLIRAALSTDEANLVDLVKFGRGNRFSLESLRPEYSKVNLTAYRLFKVPMFFLLGRYDWHVPSVLAERYFQMLDAPCARLVWFEQSAHNPPFEEPARFVRVLRDEVRQIAEGRTDCRDTGK